MFWRVAEPALMILVSLFILTQIVIPAFSSKLTFFWIFRKKSVQVMNKEGELADAHADKKMSDLGKQIEKTRGNPKNN